MSSELATVMLVLMMFCHVVDDFYLQGILAKLKQRTWWQENAPAKKYEMDYVAALFIHAFSWSVMITMPYIVLMLVRNDYKVIGVWLSALLVNTFVHTIVDTLKCNRGRISLWTDQCIHSAQVVITAVVLAVKWGLK